MTGLATFTADFHAHFTRDPNARVALGVDRDLGHLPDPTPAAIDDRVREARALLGRVRGLDRSRLSFDDALDADLAELALEAEIHRETCRLGDVARHRRLPLAGPAIGRGLFLLFVADPRPAPERLGDITARIEQVGEFLDAHLATLEEPVERWVGIDLEKVAGLPGLFDTIRSWAEQEKWDGLGRLERAAGAASAALESYAGRLRELPTRRDPHLDEATARRLVELRGIELPLEKLHGLAREFLARTRERIEELRGRLVAKHGLPRDTGVDALHGFLARLHRVKLPTGELSDVIARYEAERESILAFIEERRLFPVPPEQDMRILRTPDFMVPSVPAGAMREPPPFRPGRKTSLIYLTLSEELLDEHTELGIPGMMIHEGIPGHHLQLASAAMHRSVIRRHADFNDLCEGWTTMLEDYMLDVGYMGQLEDEARFFAKRGLSRTAARVAIDLFFMTGERSFLDLGVPCDRDADDPFRAAGELLRTVTGFVPGRVHSELNWYSQEPGYPLSYLTGNHLVWELKHDVARAWKPTGDPLDLDRDFHEIFLRAGNMPVRLLRRVFEHEGRLGPPRSVPG